MVTMLLVLAFSDHPTGHTYGVLPLAVRFVSAQVTVTSCRKQNTAAAPVMSLAEIHAAAARHVCEFTAGTAVVQMQLGNLLMHLQADRIQY
jgi:hypothetical protein